MGEHLSRFITGVLEEHWPSGEYEGIVYARRLNLRLQDGTLLKRVFDDWDCISTDLVEGQTYEMIIEAAFPESLKQFPVDPGDVPPDMRKGVIVDNQWQAPHGVYQAFNTGLYESLTGNPRQWVVIDTSIGCFLMHPDEFVEQTDTSATVGNFAQWRDGRLDLLAVV